jgi:hypothetical protein
MRRLVGFAVVGVVALWLLRFIPDGLPMLANALVIGLGAAGGTLARDPREILALAAGAAFGSVAGSLTRDPGTGGPGTGDFLAASVTIGLIVVVAGFVASFVSAARRPTGPPSR